MPLLELWKVGSLMYSEDFRTGRTLFSKGASMAEEIDVLIRQKTGGKKRLRDSFHAMMSWAEKSGRVSSRRVARVEIASQSASMRKRPRRAWIAGCDD
jgi:hypothetical protein